MVQSFHNSYLIDVFGITLTGTFLKKFHSLSFSAGSHFGVFWDILMYVPLFLERHLILSYTFGTGVFILL